MGEDEATFLDLLLELFVGVDRDGVAFAVVQSLLIDVLLDVVEELGDVVGDAVEGAGFLGERIAASHFYRAVLEVTTTEGKAYGYTLEFVFGFIRVSTISICFLDVAYFCSAALSATSIESIMSCVLVGSVLYMISALTTSVLAFAWLCPRIDVLVNSWTRVSAGSACQNVATA